MKNIGLKIKEARLSRRMTQDELAKRVGYTSRSAINKIEMGRVDLPATRIASIAKALDVRESWLLGLEDDDATLQAIEAIYWHLTPEGKSSLLEAAQHLMVSERPPR